MSIECGLSFKDFKQIWMVCTKTSENFRAASHLAIIGFRCYSLVTEGDEPDVQVKPPDPESAGSNRGGAL